MIRNILFTFLLMVFVVAADAAVVTAKPKIGINRARSIALSRAPGKVTSGELEREHGRSVYSFDIRNKKGGITEVQVNAYSGQIVSVTRETAKQERDEKKAEKSKSH